MRGPCRGQGQELPPRRRRGPGKSLAACRAGQVIADQTLKVVGGNFEQLGFDVGAPWEDSCCAK